MKTHLKIIGFIAALFAVALFADNAPTGSIEVSDGQSKNINISLPPSTITGAQIIRATEIPSPIFQLRGIPQLQASASSGSFVSMLPAYVRPEKPEEVTVELWTKDGKHWIAKWEEAK